MNLCGDDSTTRAALRESEERLRLLIEYASVALALFDREMRYLAVSRRWVDDYLPGVPDPIGKYHYVVFPNCPERWKVAHRRGLAGEVVKGQNESWQRTDGTALWANYEVRPWLARDGSVGGIVILIEDVTARKQLELDRQASEEILRERVEELEKLLELLPLPVWIASDPQCRNVRGNAAASKLLATSLDSNVSQDRSAVDAVQLRTFRHGREIPAEAMPMQRAAATATPQWEDELEIELRDGRHVLLSGGAAPLFGKEGQVRGVILAMADVTERNRLASRLLLIHERLQAVLDSTLDTVLTVNRQGIIQTANLAAGGMFGYTPKDLIGASIKLLMPEPFRTEHLTYFRRHLERSPAQPARFHREVQCLHKDGSVFPAELTVSEIPQLQLFSGIIRDITSRRQLERDVAEAATEEQLRIGRDLHDSVCQELFGLKLLAARLPRQPGTESELANRITAGLTRAHAELRQIVSGLMPVSVGQGGLMSALQRLAEQTRSEQGVACRLECPAPVEVADRFTATQLYLIAQEAIHNAVKHARPGEIQIRLEADETLRLEIRDDGVGLAGALRGQEGLGLESMMHRARLIGGTVQFAAATPHGTSVCCILPVWKTSPCES